MQIARLARILQQFKVNCSTCDMYAHQLAKLPGIRAQFTAHKGNWVESLQAQVLLLRKLTR